MFIRTGERFHFKRNAPPPPDGDPAGGSAGTGGAETTSASPAIPAAPSGEGVSLRAELKAGAESMRPKPAPETPAGPAKPGETLLHDAKAGALAKEEPAAEMPASKTPADEPNTSAELDRDAPIQIGGEVFKAEDLEHIVDFARKADEYLRTEKGNFDRRLGELKTKEAQIQERLNSPDMVLMDVLANNPDLREKFYALAVEAQPELEGKYNHAKTQQTIDELRKELHELKTGVTTRVKSEEEQRKVYTENQRKAEINTFVREVQMFSQTKAKEIGIDPEWVETIEHDAAQRIQTGKLKPNATEVNAYILSRFQKLANQDKMAAEKARNVYLGEKGKAPPPPPTGGGATRVSSPRAKTFADAERALEARIGSLS